MTYDFKFDVIDFKFGCDLQNTFSLWQDLAPDNGIGLYFQEMCY